MPDYKKHKERIEVLLDPVKDAHIIQFLNENARTRAGFIRQLLNDRAREIGYGKVSRKQVEREPRKVKALFSRDGYSGYAILEMGGNPNNDQLLRACTNSENLYDVLSQEDTKKSFLFHAYVEDGLRQWVAELQAPDGRTLTEGGDHSDIIEVLNLVSLEILN